VAVVLYTTLVDLEMISPVASWPCAAGDVFPVETTNRGSVAAAAVLLAAGKIALAPGGAVDTCTPANVLRGQPGLKAPGTVSN
jgi:hypothetical protein